MTRFAFAYLLLGVAATFAAAPSAAQAPTSAAMAEHLAEHHDTLAERVTRAAPPRQP